MTPLEQIAGKARTMNGLSDDAEHRLRSVMVLRNYLKAALSARPNLEGEG